MDSTANSYEAPPGYSEHAGTANAPYGQSRLLHGDENNGPPDKIPTHQPGLDGTPNAPYPPSEFSQYPDPPGYAPYGAMPYGHAMGPGYPPPGYAGAAPPPLPPQQQQQQQSVVVVSGQRHHHPMLIGHVQSYAGHIILACFVTWCCCFIFGIIAFILAIMASSSVMSNPRSAYSLGNASYGLSVAGIVVGVLVVIITVAVVYSSASTGSRHYGSSCPYYYYGSSCYRSRYGAYSSYSCRGYYYRRYCYYNTYYG